MVPTLDWNKLGYILASGYRKRVIYSIGDGQKTPKKISNDTKLRLNHVSAVIRDIENKGLIKCLTPELTKSKLFELTKEGMEILSQLRKME